MITGTAAEAPPQQASQLFMVGPGTVRGYLGASRRETGQRRCSMSVKSATEKVGGPTGGAGPFYGWYVVAAVFTIMTVTAGLGFYNLSVYLKAFVAQGGFSVSATSGATACFFIASGITGLGVASLIERYDP